MGRKFADKFTAFLNKWSLVICLVLVVIIITVALILIFNGRKKKIKIQEEFDWIKALGDKDNILEVSGVGSRLTVTLKDKEKINREELTKFGVTSVIAMSDKLILVIENKAAETAANIQSKL